MPIERLNRKELKQAAKQNMRKAKIGPMKVTLVFLLLTTVISMVVDFVVANPAEPIYRMMYAITNGANYEEILSAWLYGGGTQTMIALFLNILMFLYISVLSFGYYAYTLRRTDGEDAGCGDLLCGFSQVGRVILMRLAVMGFTVVWTLATVLPATIIGMVVMTTLLMTLGDSLAVMVTSIAVFYILIIVAALFALYLTMRYTLAPYLLADHPEMSGMESVRKSRVLMRGRLGEALKLSLSFIGWQLLGAFIVGIVIFVIIFVMIYSYYTSFDPYVLGIGAYALTIAGTLVAIPYNMWYLSYYYGTFAQYYRALCPKQENVQAILETDRPEPF